jgi:hypothetical protein
MLIFETNYGNFVRCQDILTFMEEESLSEIQITKVEYVLEEVYGAGTYTIGDVREWVRRCNNDC